MDKKRLFVEIIFRPFKNFHWRTEHRMERRRRCTNHNVCIPLSDFEETGTDQNRVRSGRARRPQIVAQFAVRYCRPIEPSDRQTTSMRHHDEQKRPKPTPTAHCPCAHPCIIIILCSLRPGHEPQPKPEPKPESDVKMLSTSGTEPEPNRDRAEPAAFAKRKYIYIKTRSRPRIRSRARVLI